MESNPLLCMTAACRGHWHSSDVAIKIMSCTRAELPKVLREAEVMMQLNHPNIVRAFHASVWNPAEQMRALQVSSRTPLLEQNTRGFVNSAECVEGQADGAYQHRAALLTQTRTLLSAHWQRHGLCCMMPYSQVVQCSLTVIICLFRVPCATVCAPLGAPGGAVWPDAVESPACSCQSVTGTLPTNSSTCAARSATCAAMHSHTVHTGEGGSQQRIFN